MKSFHILLGVSIFLNVLYFKYDTVDYLRPRIEKIYLKHKLLNTTDPNQAKKTIVKASFEMLKSKEAVMIWDESYGLTRRMLESGKVKTREYFRRYNYPRAFLFYGLAKFLISKNDNEGMQMLMKEFDEYITQDGQPNFEIDKVDQIVFGLTAIELFKYSAHVKYQGFLNHIDNFIKNDYDPNGIINYRKDSHNYPNDVLGMVIPYFTEKQSLSSARRQLQYFIANGIDSKTYLPAHSFNVQTATKTGSSNWGRGIGWYYVGLAYYYKQTGEFEKEYIGLTNTINKLKNSEGLWSQFPGSSDQFDASATTMFLYGQLLLNPKLYAEREILSTLGNYINEDGQIMQTSGDTYAINRYSTSFGKSELSQGFLLLLLANCAKTN